MRKLLLIALAVTVLTAGCKKTTGTGTRNTKSPGGASASSDGMSVHAPTGVVMNPGLGGGGGGSAAGAARNRALREVTHHEMKNIQLFIESASATGQMPSKETLSAALQKESPKTWKLVQDGAIVLTGTRTRESIWAYTPELQGSGGHYIVTSSGVEGVSKQELDRRLDQQRGQ